MTTRNRDDYLGLVAAGWVMAFCLPIGGIVVGLLLADRRPGHALGVLGVSLLWVVPIVYLVATLLNGDGART